MITELAITLGAGGVGTIVGFFTCAALTAGKVADLQDQRDHAIDAKVADILPLANLDIAQQAAEAISAHSRCADALTTVQGKIEDIRELLNRPRTIRKKELAAILDGDA